MRLFQRLYEFTFNQHISDSSWNWKRILFYKISLSSPVEQVQGSGKENVVTWAFGVWKCRLLSLHTVAKENGRLDRQNSSLCYAAESGLQTLVSLPPLSAPIICPRAAEQQIPAVVAPCTLRILRVILASFQGIYVTLHFSHVGLPSSMGVVLEELHTQFVACSLQCMVLPQIVYAYVIFHIWQYICDSTRRYSTLFPTLTCVSDHSWGNTTESPVFGSTLFL